MEFKTYVQSVVAAYVEKQDLNMIFIKHYNTLDISEEEILAGVENTEDKVFLYHKYAMYEMHGAYAPFLGWIRLCYDRFYKDSMSVESFLKECHVYPMHIEAIAGFIRTNNCTRKEDILNFEIGYETYRILEDLLGILEYISEQHHLILILSKFHLAPFSTIKLFSMLIDKTKNIHAILMYNDEFSIAGYKKKVWDELLQKSEDKNLQFEWGSLDSERTADIHDDFWFDKSRKDEYLSKLTNMYYTFALEDANYYMNDIMYRLDAKTLSFSPEETLPFLRLSAMIDMNLGSANHALVICDKMSGLISHQDVDEYSKYLYHYTCARARMILSQTDAVRTHCSKCMDIARGMGDDFLVCKAEILLTTALCGIAKDIFEYDFSYSVDTRMIDRAKKYGFINFLAYLYVFGFENDQESIKAIADGKMEPHYFELGIKIGTSIENNNFLMNAYMKNIILYSRAGYHHYVREMYKKRLGVLKRPNPLREAHMYAGLGYNSIILEDFEKAHTYLTQSVINLTDLDEPDDVLNSLYNLAMNYFVAEAYQNTIEVIDLILKMLKEMGFTTIRACSTTKLYSLIAISCYYQSEYYNSYYYLSKMEIIAEHMLMVLQKTHQGSWDEDLLLYHLVKGMLYNYENQYELCRIELESVKKYMETASGAVFFTMPILAQELASLYLKKDRQKEAEDALLEGIEFCEREGLPRHKKKLQYFLENKKRDPEPILAEKTELPVKRILQLSRQAGTQNKLSKRENDIKFLTVLQEAISRENLTVEDLFMNTSAVLKNSYTMDDIVILRRKDGVQSVIKHKESDDISDEDAERIFSFFKEYRQAFLTNRTDKNFTQFQPVMKPFNEEHIMTMIGIPIMESSGTETVFLAYIKIKPRSIGRRFLMNEEDLMILKFAFSQFCEMMRRIDNRIMIENMNHRLEQSAITDHLTGITNRNGFSKRAEMICRQDESRINVILYLDLDNFKYYNDTFGHDIGDLVLVAFANMFKRMTKDKGIAVRYGGDEFIILLFDQDERDAEKLAKQIYDEIKDGFVDQIGARLDREIRIPDDKKISCSIGISSFHGGSKAALETALNQADQMLYYVKRNGKSRYKLYHIHEDD